MSAVLTQDEQRDELLRRADRHDANARATYDRADAALGRGDRARADRLYAAGEALEACADLCRAGAQEIGWSS